MLVLDAPPSPDNDASAWIVAADALADAAEATGRRAVVVATMAECLNEGCATHIGERGLTPLLGLQRGARRAGGRRDRRCTLRSPRMHAVDAARRYSSRRRGRGQGQARDVRASRSRRHGRRRQREVESAAAGSAIPITLKALGLAHKSESGAVEGRLRRRRSCDRRAGRDAGCRRLPGRGHRDRCGRRGAGRRAPRSADRVAGHARFRRRDDRAVERRDAPARAGDGRRRARGAGDAAQLSVAHRLPRSAGRRHRCAGRPGGHA